MKQHYEPRPNAMMCKLDDILLDVTWGKIAQQYFPDKSVSWFYNKLRGVDGNGGAGEFTPDEKEHLQGALFDLSERIRNAAQSIEV